jgi:hypothetical protein
MLWSSILAFLVCGLGAPFFSANAACVVPPSGLISWWSGNGNANDALGANNGSLQGLTTFQLGLVGQAFSLNGSTDYIYIPDSPSLRPTQFTLAGWIKGTAFSGGGWNTIIARGTTGSGGLGCCGESYGLFIYQGKPQFTSYSTNGGDTLNATNVVTPGVWHFVAATFDGNFKRIYYDGVLVATNVQTNAILYDTNATPTTIGDDWNNNSPGGNKFNGLLDEIDLYNRALSDSEILSLYNAGSDGKCGGPVTAGSVPYFTDFESGIGPEWSMPVVSGAESLCF